MSLKCMCLIIGSLHHASTLAQVHGKLSKRMLAFGRCRNAPPQQDLTVKMQLIRIMVISLAINRPINHNSSLCLTKPPQAEYH
jgi:hypothetical protein